MAVYLAALLVYGAFAFSGTAALIQGAAVVLLYAFFDLFWTHVRDKVWYFPLSSFISGFVLAIVSKPDLPILLVVFLPLLAVFSKQLLHFGRMRHIFNPAAFAVGVTSFFIPTVTWWATGWDVFPLMILLIPSFFVLWRQDRWHVALPFFLSYTFFLSLFLLSTGVPFSNLQGILTAQLVSGTLLFFTTVMLIEPLTSTFPTRNHRVIYGLLVAVFSVIVTVVLRFFDFHHQDPLILGLLLGNFSAGLLFLPRRKRDIIHHE